MEIKQKKLFSIFNFVANIITKDKREKILTAASWDCGDGWKIEHQLNGDLHNRFGAAVIDEDGSKEYYRFGKRHRLNGAAMEFAHGGGLWFIDGEKLTREYIQALPEKNKEKLKIPKKYW